MSRYYEDVDIPSGNFRFPRPRPGMVNDLGNPQFNNVHQPWAPIPGGTNYRPRFPPIPRHPNYTRTTENVYNYAAHPQPNSYRRFPNRFKYNRNYSHYNQRADGGTQNLRMAFDRFLINLNANAYESSQDNSCKPEGAVEEQWHSKKNESSKPVPESNQEAIKKSALAAKLKKSLENFQKDASKKKINLSIINNSDISKTDTSAKLPEIHPHFQFDLPLTVEDLKAIGRCPSGSAPDEPAGDGASDIERQTFAQDTGSSSDSPVEISPEVIFIKHSRKRKSSESLGAEVIQKKSCMRRRHRSASPDLCTKSSSTSVNGGGQLQQSSQESRHNSLPTISGANEKSADREKPPQSSTIMQLLGIRRREFDELVNQPRSPRVHFMLGLLRKRHNELLMQREMRSRISSKANKNQPGNSQRPDFPNSNIIASPDDHDKSNPLEGMGASDTIDQLSDILLDSSLEIDISSLPQELIDQLGTFLEMSTEVGPFDDEAGNFDDEEGRGGSSEHISAESKTDAIIDGGNSRETLLQGMPSEQMNVAEKSNESNVTVNNSFSFIRIKKELANFDDSVINRSENLIETLVQGRPGEGRHVSDKSKNSNVAESFSIIPTEKEMAGNHRTAVFGGMSGNFSREQGAVDKNKANRLDRIFGENISTSLIKNGRVIPIENETRNSVFHNTSTELNIKREENSDVHVSSEALDSISSESLVGSHPMNLSVQSEDLEPESMKSSSSVVAQSCLSRICSGVSQPEEESSNPVHFFNSRQGSLRTNSVNEQCNSFPSTTDQPCASRMDSDLNNLESDIIASLWSIDLKILELMEEKNVLYEKLSRSRRERGDYLTNRNAFSDHQPGRCTSLSSPNRETPRTLPSTPPIRNLPQTSSSVSVTSENVIRSGSLIASEKSVGCISTEPPSPAPKVPENVFPSTSGNVSGKTIPRLPANISFSNASEYFMPTSSEAELNNLVTSTPTIHTSSASFIRPRSVVEDSPCKVKNAPKHHGKPEHVSLVENNMPAEVISTLIMVQPPPPSSSSTSKVLRRLPCKENEKSSKVGEISSKKDEKLSKENEKSSKKEERSSNKEEKSSKKDKHSCQNAGQTRQLSEGKCSDESVKSQNVPLDMSQKDPSSAKSSAGHSRTVITEPDKGKPADDSIEIVYDAKLQEDPSHLSKGEFKGHKDSVLAIKVYGKFLFASCSDKCVYCYDLNTHEVIRKFQGHTDTVTCIYAKLVGKKKYELYSGSHDKRLLVFISEVSQYTHCRTTTEPIQCMEEGWGNLYIGTKGGMIERFKMGKGDFIKPPLFKSKNEIMAIQTTLEGPRKVLIVASRNMPIVVRDAHTGLLLRSINEEQAKNTTYCIFVHYGIVYSGVRNLGITACDYTNGKVLRTYKGCGLIVAVKVSEAKVYAASYDGKIYIYDIQSQRPCCEIKASDKMLLCMEQIDNTIYAGSIDGKLKFWKLPQQAT